MVRAPEKTYVMQPCPALYGVGFRCENSLSVRKYVFFDKKPAHRIGSVLWCGVAPVACGTAHGNYRLALVASAGAGTNDMAPARRRSSRLIDQKPSAIAQVGLGFGSLSDRPALSHCWG